MLLAMGLVLFYAGLPLAARIVLSGLAAVAYNGLLDGGPTGQTLGKRVLRIRCVADETGDVLGQNRGLGRAAVTYAFGFAAVLSPVGVLVPLLDGLWPLWDRQRQTWHDKAVRSVVVVA